MRIVRMGECNKCGDCCRMETLKARVEAYKKAGIPYDLVNRDCDKFDPKTGLCKDYENRPEVCRLFPKEPADI